MPSTCQPIKVLSRGGERGIILFKPCKLYNCQEGLSCRKVPFLLRKGKGGNHICNDIATSMREHSTKVQLQP